MKPNEPNEPRYSGPGDCQCGDPRWIEYLKKIEKSKETDTSGNQPKKTAANSGKDHK